MKDVAKRAGVSLITVSRVINRSSYVHADTRARVLAVIEELQYVPNRMASSLRSRQTGTLALLLPTITNAFWTTIARGAEDEAESRGYSVFLCNTDDDPAKEARYLDVIVRHRVDGVVVVPTSESAPALCRLQRYEVALVQLHRKVAGIESDIVRGDSRGAMIALTTHLLAAGCQRIAYVGGPPAMFMGHDRLTGFQEAMTGAGCAVCPELVKTGPFGPESGYALTKDLLARSPRPEAIVITNSRLALGALRALDEAGVRIPDDMAVATFYDIPALDPYAARLTTVTQPAYEIGRLGVRRLLDRIAGAAGPPEELIFPNHIVAH
jgi:LacI family transcriptional regulator